MNWSSRLSKYFGMLPMLLLLVAAVTNAQIVDPQNVLIRNVHLVLGNDEADDVPVNILIRENKLEVISKDEIPIEEAAMAIDGREGYVLGSLAIGETPSFIILNQDPRKNFEVMQDTKFFTVFSVHNGNLISNNLFEVEEEVAPPEEVPSAWRAYTPPPMALPTTYGDTTKFNRFESKYISGIFLAAAVLDRQNWQGARGLPIY